MKKLRALAVLAFALVPTLLIPSAHAQVVVQDQGLQQFCGNWGSDGGYTCMGLSGQLIKDDTEQDPNHDIFTIVVRAWDSTNDNYGIGDMWLETQTQTSVGGGAYQPALLDKWDPQSQQTSSQQQITFSYAGISVPITMPASKTDIYDNLNYYSTLYVAWHVHMDCNCPPPPIPNPGWAEFAVAFSVPEGGIVAINVYLHLRFTNPPADSNPFTLTWSGWTPSYGITFQYPPPPPPRRCPPVC